jgi:hypothetical protein
MTSCCYPSSFGTPTVSPSAERIGHNLPTILTSAERR